VWHFEIWKALLSNFPPMQNLSLEQQNYRLVMLFWGFSGTNRTLKLLLSSAYLYGFDTQCAITPKKVKILDIP
jgi:hypothetical protein